MQFGNRLLLLFMYVLNFKIYSLRKPKVFALQILRSLTDERRSRSKNFPLFLWIKELAFENLKGSNVRNVLGIRKLI